jgi:iron complex outermembrane recepter protein
MNISNSIFSRLLISITTVLSILQVPVHAQTGTLEEIVVTAQRRVQSLQDVPISIETVSGQAIRDSGFRDLKELANFSPGLVLDEEGMEGQSVQIRGAGTQGKNLGIEQAAPTFVDGIHFGRNSSNKSAFLDIERIEILRGPQPVFFGQNATAGAISIITKRPGDEWEGFVEGEVSRFDTQQIEFGAGGPINDTFGIRVAGRYERTDGFMQDLLTGEAFPNQDIKVGRVTLQWTPNERFQAMAKFDYADQAFGDRAEAWFINKQPTPFDPRFPNTVLFTGVEGVQFALPLPTKVGDIGRLGQRNGPTFISSPLSITVANTASNDNGAFDTTRRTGAGLDTGPGWRGFDIPQAFKEGDFTSVVNSKPWNAFIELEYQLSDDIQLTSLTGFSRQAFETIRGANGFFATSTRYREEDFNQWSQELRLTSDTGGAIEWMAGAYWQQNELDTQSDQWEGNNIGGIRGNRADEDSRWISAFAALTFNFYDDKASLDIGGRYTDIHKEGNGWNIVADWIIENPVTGLPETITRGVRMPVDYNHAYIIGRTPYKAAPLAASLGGGLAEDGVHGVINENSFDPSIVLRYRPTNDISMYAKYAESFKGGGFDTGVAWLPFIDEDFTFKPENTNIWEVGFRGSFFEGAATAELTVFRTIFNDLQVSALDEQLDPPRNRTTNAARQKSQGVEFGGKFAATDKLTLGLSGIIMNAEMLSFPGAACTRAERATGLCTGPSNTIDRSGQPARNAPDWQVTGNVNYEMPIMDRFKSDFNANITASDGYIINRAWDPEVRMDSEVDASVSLGFSDMTDTWSVTFFGRNLMSPKPTYHPEDDFFDQDGADSTTLRESNFTTYGVRLGYNF